jgi:hypothetical protein
VILLLPTAFAATLSGTVTGADGSPLAGVDIVAYDARLNYAAARTTTDGGFTITNVPAGRYRLRALPSDSDPHVDRFLPDTWDFCAADVFTVASADAVDALDFGLPRGGEITGRLLGGDGAPVPEAQVLAIGASERSALVSRLGTVDADGAFSIVGLDGEPDALEPYLVYVGATGWPRQYLGPSYTDDDAGEVLVTPGGSTPLGDRTLLDGITVTGTVAGPDGPVPGGTVYVFSSSQVISVDIEADGTYVADGLPPGNVVSWASADGLATTYYPNADRPGESLSAPDEGQVLDGADLRLPRENTLTVQILGEGDRSDVSVLLYNDTLSVGRGAPVEEDGTVTIDALHPGTYSLFVYGADVGSTDDFVRDTSGAVRDIVIDGATTLDVEMPAGAGFSGTVRDDAGAPVYGAYVYSTTADGENTEVAVTDAEGVYTLGGLPGGIYTLRASYAPYCDNDPGFVTVYWPDALQPDDALVTTLAVGEGRADVDFVLFQDGDHDAMGDAWEAEHGLDPERDDAGEDPDGDGYVNVEEWVLGSDPTGPAVGPGTVCGSGCGAGAGGALVWMVPLLARRRRSAA